MRRSVIDRSNPVIIQCDAEALRVLDRVAKQVDDKAAWNTLSHAAHYLFDRFAYPRIKKAGI